MIDVLRCGDFMGRRFVLSAKKIIDCAIQHLCQSGKQLGSGVSLTGLPQANGGLIDVESGGNLILTQTATFSCFLETQTFASFRSHKYEK